MIDNVKKLLCAITTQFIEQNLIVSDAIAKTSKLTLEQHLNNSVQTTQLFELHRNFKFKKFSTARYNILRLTTIAAILHDLGKGVIRWQNHAHADNLKSVGIRHELVVLPYIWQFLRNTTIVELTAEEVDMICIAIAAHHGKISTCDAHIQKLHSTNSYIYSQLNVQLASQFYNNYTVDNYQNELFNYLNTIATKLALQKHNNQHQFQHQVLLYNIIRSNLRTIDQYTSALEDDYNTRQLQPIFTPYQLNTTHRLRPLQQKVANSTKKWIVLRARTGSGKSLASSIFIDNHIKNNHADRANVCMPTRFTANKFFDENTTAGTFSALHHSTAKITNTFDAELYYWSQQGEISYTVSTIDHVLNSLTLYTEKLRTRCVNLMHSCVVIDEVDFYDNWLLAN